MYFFVNDYNSICYPEILDFLKENLDEFNPGYGFDSHSEKAKALIRKALADDRVDIHFLPGGTSANIIGCASGMRQQDSILALSTGHIKGHEAGSIEATGIKVELCYADTGKLSRKILEREIGKFDTEFTTMPKKVYISNTTELGEVYTKAELMDIYDFCKAHDMYLFIDGARLAAALASDKCDYTMKDLTKMCDIFYLGGTKAGFLFGEALVIVNDDLKKDVLKLIKQKGAMLAKGFISGLMWERVFSEEDFYLKGSRHAYLSAKLLADGLVKKGYKLNPAFESNQIFVDLNDEKLKLWQDVAKFEIMDSFDGIHRVRLVTTFRTKKSDIVGFLEEIG